ncbi:YPDG domain-containing protein, partial [Corynebacterium sp. HMSC30G07]|uniref:YPDG domain-containing protein n=1 Tax=Corynebacterium sp. HMSC30G07 TaxID=1581072 RepID=UPI000A734C84
TTAPDGTTFTPGDNAPDGVKVNENTGEITVTIPEDAKPGDKITVPVVVTYPDGSKDNVDVTVTVEQPDTPPTKDNENYEPGYEDGSGKPGEDVTIDKPDFKDKDGNNTTAPDGTTFTPGDNAPDGVKVDENTGEITVTIPEDAKPGDKITVPVVVTYPDGSKDNVEVTVTVEQPNVGDRDKPEIDTGKCIASALGFGLPMIALLPLGLASQVDVPGLTPIANELSARLEQVNSQIQQQIGVYNPQMASQVAEINARLKSVGADLFTVVTSLALITAGILTGTMIYKNCVPDGTTDVTVEDLKLKGSSGKEYELSSKKDNTSN